MNKSTQCNEEINKVKIGKYELSKDFLIFLIISVLLGSVAAIDSTSMANRLYEDLNFTIMQRSLLETPRELPGFLTVVLIGILNGLGDIRISAVANILGGIGLLFFGLVPNQFSLVLIFLVIYSTGQHIYLPMASSITMSFARGESFGKSMGRVQGLGNLSIIITSAVLYVLYRFFHPSYQAVFIAAACFMISAGILFLFIRNNGQKVISEKRFIYRREYKLYYMMSVVNGARKQITMIFVPWLIIDVYKQPVTTITILFFIVCAINIFFKPWFGGLIDKRGEKYAMQFEAVVMFIACIGFIYAKTLFDFKGALIVAGICYIMDKLMESASMARATYVKKLSGDPSEVARTLSMGQSMDHLISMLIPLLAGYVWYSNGPEGYRYVFSGALIISLINFLIASRVKTN